MKEIIIKLPDIEEILGTAWHGGEPEFQYLTGELIRSPELENISPDSSYSVRMSIENAVRLRDLLSAALALLSPPR